MSPSVDDPRITSASFPRSRGDEPARLYLRTPKQVFSPLTRG